MINKLLILILISLSSFSAQNKTNSNCKNNTLSLLEIMQSDLIFSYENSIDVLKSPFNFDGRDFAISGAIIALTGASFTIDNKIRKAVTSNKNSLTDKITSVGENLGNAKYGTILSALLYSSGLIFKNKDIRETGQMLAEAMLLNGIYTQFLKLLFVRYRPYTGNTNLRMEPFEFELNPDENSLPSGHTSTAFTIATVLSEKINNTYISIALYSLAALTAYQRIYANAHWFSDTFMGAALGTVIGLKISSLHADRNNENLSMKYYIYPQFGSNGYGISFSLLF